MPGARSRSDWLAGHPIGGGGGGGEMSLDASHLLSHYQTHLSTVPEHHGALSLKEEEEGEEGEEEEEEEGERVVREIECLGTVGISTISQLIVEVR